MSSAFNLVYEAEETEVMFKHLMSCGSRAIAFNTVYGEGHMSAYADCILILPIVFNTIRHDGPRRQKLDCAAEGRFLV